MKTKQSKHEIELRYCIAEIVRKKIESGQDRVWRLSDFKNLSFTAVAKALSRLCYSGVIQRIGKGLYYRPRETVFGKSKPSPNDLRNLSTQQRVFPSGCSVANLLGFSTQQASRVEVSTTGLSLPRLLISKEATIHTRRPDSWLKLSSKDAAILEFIRDRGKFSELSLEKTKEKLLDHFRDLEQFERLFKISESEPPRVRAILGAIGEEIGCSKKHLEILRKSLNSLSRFDFGNLIKLKYAKQWQAKERKLRKSI